MMPLKISILLICCYLVWRTIDQLGPREVWMTAREAHAGWLFAAVGVLASSLLVWSIKWHRILERRCETPLSFVLTLVMANGFINLFTPTAKLGGGILRAMALRRRWHLPFSAAYGEVLVDQSTHFIGKLLLIALLLAATMALPELGLGYWPIPGAILFFGATLLWLPLRQKLWKIVTKGGAGSFFQNYAARLSAKIGLREGGNAWMTNLFEPLLHRGSNRAVYFNDIGMSMLTFGLFCWSNALVLKALGAAAPLATVGLVVLCGYLIGTMLGIMGGIGVTELFLMELYTMAGIAPEAATAAALLHRGLFYGFMLVFGGPAALVVSKRVG